MNVTISDLRTAVLAAINEVSGEQWTNAQLDLAINASHREIARHLIELEPSYLVTSGTISKVAGTVAYSLASFTDFYLLNQLLTSSDVEYPHYRPTIGMGYVFRHNTLYIYPTGLSDTMTLWYNYQVSDLTDASPTMPLPDACKNAVVFGAAMLLKGQDSGFKHAQWLASMYAIGRAGMTSLVGRSSSNVGYSEVRRQSY
jgi:hypothetical protein